MEVKDGWDVVGNGREKQVAGSCIAIWYNILSSQCQCHMTKMCQCARSDCGNQIKPPSYLWWEGLGMGCIQVYHFPHTSPDVVYVVWNWNVAVVLSPTRSTC